MVHPGEDAKVFGDSKTVLVLAGRLLIQSTKRLYHMIFLGSNIPPLRCLIMMLLEHSCVSLDYCGSPSGDALQGNQNAGYGRLWPS
jgi:hypothetical protein